MDQFFAHSSRGDSPAQTYEAHIRGVCERALKYASEAACYSSSATAEMLSKIVRESAVLHDLGKLDDKNQEVLRDPKAAYKSLPVNHADAGSAALQLYNRLYAALAVYSHHRGLPDLVNESRRGAAIFRDDCIETREYVDKTLGELFSRHHAFFSPLSDEKPQAYTGDISVFLRLALSCLADADHTDTAAAYGQVPKKEELPQLRAEERLAALDRYVSGLDSDDKRDRLRGEMYDSCRTAEVDGHFSSCDSPVGSGKTTAVMAHLLHQAVLRNARRIFVVLPYTGIIEQSVAVYRRSLVLPGENPEEVVAELHHRADFDDYDTHYLTALWRAPIVVTTAVAFFETLSSCRPSALRRLHELPGSVVFLDEAHNALPLGLLPLAWHWMNAFAEEWSCYWVLASGSLVRFWELEQLLETGMAQPKVPELVAPELRERLMQYEKKRIVFRWYDKPLSRQELAARVQNAPGPRLLILNTVKSAAVIAADIAKSFGRDQVEHLSAALTPEDRIKTTDRIKRRLGDPTDTDWTLVATSCVEAGMDFSFRTGFRELSSLISLLQASGRVNRHGEYAGSEMVSFNLKDDSMLSRNQNLKYSIEVLHDYFEKKVEITPELSTDSLNEELARNDGYLDNVKDLSEQEETLQFQTVNEEFTVIDNDTVTVLVDESFAEEVRHGQSNWHELQKKSVSIRRSMIKKRNAEKIRGDIYLWTAGYDSFLGYMRGNLDNES